MPVTRSRKILQSPENQDFQANFQYGGPHMGDNRPKTRFAHAWKKSLAHLVLG